MLTEKWWMALAFLLGMVAGQEVGFHRGFQAGVFEERAAAFESGDCYCGDICCEEHDAEDLARTNR